MAVVLGCGHASQLFDVDYMEETPQVHLHSLTDEEEYKTLGYGKVELCCHGCGESVLVLYDRSNSRKRHLSIRNRFVKKHVECPNRAYENHCPNYRSSWGTLDVRYKNRCAPSTRVKVEERQAQ